MAYSSWDDMAGAMNAMADGQYVANRISAEAAHDQWKANMEQAAQMSQLNASMDRQNAKLDSLAGITEAGFRVLNQNVRSLTDVTADGFATLATRLTSQHTVLVSIDEAIRHPKAIAAGEQFRLGVQLLQNQLFEEARTALNESVQLDSLQAITYLALGLTEEVLGRKPEAYLAFEKAWRYAGLTRDVSVARDQAGSLKATALILAYNCATATDKDDLLAEALKAGYSDGPEKDCPELWYMVAQLKHDLGQDCSTELLHAMRIAPELSLLAVRDNMPAAKEIAEQVYWAPQVQTMIEMERLVDAVWDSYKTGTPRELGASAYEDITYALLIHPKFARVSWYKKNDYEKDIADQTTKGFLEEDQQNLAAARTAFDETRAERAGLHEVLGRRLGMFAPKLDKSQLAQMQHNATLRIQVLDAHTATLEVAIAELTDNVTQRTANEERYRERHALQQQYCDLIVKSQVRRTDILRLT